MNTRISAFAICVEVICYHILCMAVTLKSHKILHIAVELQWLDQIQILKIGSKQELKPFQIKSV